MAKRFSTETVLELLFDDDLHLSDGCSSDEECSEGPSYLGNDELHPQELNTFDRAITSAGEANSGRGSSDDCEDDEVMKILCLLFLQGMKD